MFCGKCGAKNADDAAFCSECGAKINGNGIVKNDTSIVVSPNNQNRKVGIIAVLVIAVVVIGVLITVFGGRGYKKTVEKFVDAQFDADAEAICKLIPEKVMDYVMEEEGYDDDEFDEFIEEGNEELQDLLDEIENYYGKNWKVSSEILKAEEVTGDDLDNLKDEYSEMGVEVSAAKTIEIQMTVKSGETENSNSGEVSVIKVGRSWYLDFMSMGNLF